MTYEIQVAHLAISDAAEAFFWLNERAATAAFQWFEGLIKAIRSLERSPFRCAVARESAFFDEEIRHLDYGKYRILFTVKGKTVIVLRIRHGSRDYLRSEDEIG